MCVWTSHLLQLCGHSQHAGERSQIGVTDYYYNRHRLAAPIDSPIHPLDIYRTLLGWVKHSSSLRSSSFIEFHRIYMQRGQNHSIFVLLCPPPCPNPPSPPPRRLTGSRYLFLVRFFFPFIRDFSCRVSLAAVRERGDIVKDREAVQQSV